MNLLTGKNIVVYDLEIQNVIDGKKITWADHDKMGLSVGCLFDYETGDYSIYFEKDRHALAERLNRAALIVAFNQIGFDNVLLRAIGTYLKPDSELSNYDMLLESRKAVGWKGGRFPSGLKLDNHLESTFGKSLMKTEHGSQAPVMWQEGKIGEVTSYCLADVRREKMLFEHIVNKGWASTEAYGKRFFELDSINKVLAR